MRYWTAALLFLGVLAGGAAQAESARSKARLGLILGYNSPYPSEWGYNAGFNLGDIARLSGGYGTYEVSVANSSLELKTIGGQLNFFLPNMNFTPTIGVGYAKVTATVRGSVGGLDSFGFTASDNHTYVSAGFDWQTDGGFQLGAGWNHSLKSGTEGAVYAQIGWFFW